jgi:hypothetical protein
MAPVEGALMGRFQPRVKPISGHAPVPFPKVLPPENSQGKRDRGLFAGGRTVSYLTDFLRSKGWTKDEHRLGMTSPDGKFVPLNVIEHEARGLEKLANRSSNLFDTSKFGRPIEKTKFNPYTKLKMRLDLGMNEDLEFHCNIFTGPNKIFVFVAHGDKALILEDDPFLFPSDKLVGQIQLFRGAIR